MSEHERRAGLNEALFREVNERLGELADRFALGELDLICECSDVTCNERIRMDRAEYEELRSDPTHFGVAPGHEQADVEAVVDRRDGYDIVRKREGEPAEVARATDPRT